MLSQSKNISIPFFLSIRGFYPIPTSQLLDSILGYLNPIQNLTLKFLLLSVLISFCHFFVVSQLVCLQVHQICYISRLSPPSFDHSDNILLRVFFIYLLIIQGLLNAKSDENLIFYKFLPVSISRILLLPRGHMICTFTGNFMGVIDILAR